MLKVYANEPGIESEFGYEYSYLPVYVVLRETRNTVSVSDWSAENVVLRNT